MISFPFRLSPFFALGIIPLLASFSFAQLPIQSDAAVQPSAGHFLLRQQVEYEKLARDPTGFGHQVREFIATTNITYGLKSDFALTANIPLIWQSVDSEVTDHSGHGGGDEGNPFPFPFPFPPPPGTDTSGHPLGSDFGLDDITIGFKWRVYEHDFGPIDTLRFAILGAVETPTGADAFSSDSWDPEIGAVISYIQGRHGANASLEWKFNTGKHPLNLHAGKGEDDALFYNASYLFRLLPSQYTARSKDATYVLLEALGTYETNGDNEILLAPGVMYETKNIALEFSIGFPVFQSIDNRPKTDLTLTAGIRFFF